MLPVKYILMVSVMHWSKIMSFFFSPFLLSFDYCISRRMKGEREEEIEGLENSWSPFTFLSGVKWTDWCSSQCTAL